MRGSDESRFDKLLVFLASHFLLKSSELLNLQSENDLLYSIDAETYQIISATRKLAEDSYIDEENYKGKFCYSTLCGRPEACNQCKEISHGRVHRRSWIEKSDIDHGTYIVHGKGTTQNGKKVIQVTTNQIRSVKNAWEAQERDAESKDFLIDVLGILSDTKSKNPADRFRKNAGLRCGFFLTVMEYFYSFSEQKQRFLRTAIRQNQIIIRRRMSFPQKHTESCKN